MAKDKSMKNPASTADVLKHLNGVDFPADKDALMNYAKSKNAKKDVMDALNMLPDKEYESSAEVMEEMGMSKDMKMDKDMDREMDEEEMDKDMG